MRWEHIAFPAIVRASFILRGLGNHWQVLGTEVTRSSVSFNKTIPAGVLRKDRGETGSATMLM